jgi:hypothetical protein
LGSGTCRWRVGHYAGAVCPTLKNRGVVEMKGIRQLTAW